MEAAAATEGGDFPFCSRRCRMADLDRWFTEDYAIPGEAADEVADEDRPES